MVGNILKSNFKISSCILLTLCRYNGRPLQNDSRVTTTWFDAKQAKELGVPPPSAAQNTKSQRRHGDDVLSPSSHDSVRGGVTASGQVDVSESDGSQVLSCLSPVSSRTSTPAHRRSRHASISSQDIGRKERCDSSDRSESQVNSYSYSSREKGYVSSRRDRSESYSSRVFHHRARRVTEDTERGRLLDVERETRKRRASSPARSYTPLSKRSKDDATEERKRNIFDRLGPSSDLKSKERRASIQSQSPSPRHHRTRSRHDSSRVSRDRSHSPQYSHRTRHSSTKESDDRESKKVERRSSRLRSDSHREGERGEERDGASEPRGQTKKEEREKKEREQESHKKDKGSSHDMDGDGGVCSQSTGEEMEEEEEEGEISGTEARSYEPEDMRCKLERQRKEREEREVCNISWDEADDGADEGGTETVQEETESHPPEELKEADGSGKNAATADTEKKDNGQMQNSEKRENDKLKKDDNEQVTEGEKKKNDLHKDEKKDDELLLKKDGDLHKEAVSSSSESEVKAEQQAVEKVKEGNEQAQQEGMEVVDAVDVKEGLARDVKEGPAQDMKEGTAQKPAEKVKGRRKGRERKEKSKRRRKSVSDAKLDDTDSHKEAQVVGGSEKPSLNSSVETENISRDQTPPADLPNSRDYSDRDVTPPLEVLQSMERSYQQPFYPTVPFHPIPCTTTTAASIAAYHQLFSSQGHLQQLAQDGEALPPHVLPSTAVPFPLAAPLVSGTMATPGVWPVQVASGVSPAQWQLWLDNQRALSAVASSSTTGEGSDGLTSGTTVQATLQSTGMGVETTGIALQSTGTGVETTGIALQSTGTGVETTGIALQSTGTGVETTGIALQSTGTGVETTGIGAQIIGLPKDETVQVTTEVSTKSAEGSDVTPATGEVCVVTSHEDTRRPPGVSPPSHESVVSAAVVETPAVQDGGTQTVLTAVTSDKSSQSGPELVSDSAAAAGPGKLSVASQTVAQTRRPVKRRKMDAKCRTQYKEMMQQFRNHAAVLTASTKILIRYVLKPSVFA